MASERDAARGVHGVLDQDEVERVLAREFFRPSVEPERAPDASDSPPAPAPVRLHPRARRRRAKPKPDHYEVI